MAVKLNRTAYEYAKRLIADGRTVLDDRDAWSEHQPSAQDENRFIESAAAHLHGMLEALPTR